jgi:hypothetical protein
MALYSIPGPTDPPQQKPLDVKDETRLSEGEVPSSLEDDVAAGPATEPVPLRWKIASIVLVTAIGFGSQWSSGITGAMKTTMKKELKINNTQFSLLEASEDFMVTALMLLSGIVTDRIGGAGTTRISLPFKPSLTTYL